MGGKVMKKRKGTKRRMMKRHSQKDNENTHEIFILEEVFPFGKLD
jgi:hypothetical protein